MAGWLDTFQGFHCLTSLATLLNVSTGRAKDCPLQLKLHGTCVGGGRPLFKSFVLSVPVKRNDLNLAPVYNRA